MVRGAAGTYSDDDNASLGSAAAAEEGGAAAEAGERSPLWHRRRCDFKIESIYGTI